MVDSHDVHRGRQRLTFDVTVVPIDWGDRSDFAHRTRCVDEARTFPSLDPPQLRMNPAGVTLRRDGIALRRRLIARLQPTTRRAVHVGADLVSTIGIEWAWG